MAEYGFSVTRVFSYKDEIEDYTENTGQGYPYSGTFHTAQAYRDKMIYIQDFQKQSPKDHFII